MRHASTAFSQSAHRDSTRWRSAAHLAARVLAATTAVHLVWLLLPVPALALLDRIVQQEAHIRLCAHLAHTRPAGLPTASLVLLGLTLLTMAVRVKLLVTSCVT